MQKIDYSAMKPTRDFVQDIARVLGKFQQLFIAPKPHDWQRGMEITETGLQTQPLANDIRAKLDVAQGRFTMADDVWEFAEHSAQEFHEYLQGLLTKHADSRQLEKPEFTTSAAIFDSTQASRLTEATYWASQQLVSFGTSLPQDQVSPLLIFPHHYDVSLVWFLNGLDNEQQVGFGFSPGDDFIAEPYFYVTAWPEPADFIKLQLPAPAFWQKDGFSGAILPYNALIDMSESEKIVQKYFKAVSQRSQLLH